MELKAFIEAILFAAQKPLTIKEIKVLLQKPEASDGVRNDEVSEQIRALKKVKDSEIAETLQDLRRDYEEQKRSFLIQEIAGATQLVSRPEFAPWLKPLFEEQRSGRLSSASLETLAIIAYRQPITRADIESVRGVAVDGVMQTLLERGLVTITGRSDAPGRPMLFGTTRLFLEHFGLNDLNELPAAEELRKVNLHSGEPVDHREIIGNNLIQEKTDHVESASAPETN